jgi:hypothetical protein
VALGQSGLNGALSPLRVGSLMDHEITIDLPPFALACTRPGL